MRTLKSKFIFWICSLFILTGIIIFIPLSIILPDKISSQILKRDIRIAHYLSREVCELLFINNKLALKLLLEDRLENLSDAIYIFIRGRDDAIISSTFQEGFPKGLLRINNPSENLYSVSKLNINGKRAYDIAIPLLRGELGSLHLGVSLESSKTEIAEFTKINYYVAIVIFIGMGVGILIFTLLSVFLSDRIKKLEDFATKVGKGDLNDTIDIRTKDEIGSLAASFNKMVVDLKEKIETIKRLSYLEERNRIAVEFHDGIAQDLATIIKRLELCEELFKNEPAEGFAELKTLTDNTKDILDKTRQAIFDLKLPQGADFNLLNNLKNHIRDYQKQYNINIKFIVFGPLNNIPMDKSKSIFYIISEALTNIRKHACAKNAELRLEYSGNNELIIDIKDDGQGFDLKEAESSAPNRGKWGLMGMRQRAVSLGGTMLINTVPDLGTEISFDIPLSKN